MASEQQRIATEKKEGTEELPLESSPYVKCTDLEDYNEKGYGAHGHLQPIENSRTGGATDAPTLSGGGLSRTQAEAVDSVNRCGAV